MYHFSLSCIGEGNGSPLKCSCLENPRDGEAWWAAVCGVAQSRTRLKWLSIAMYLTIKCVYLVGWDSVLFILLLVLLNMMSTWPVNRCCMKGYSWRVELSFCCCCSVAKSYLSLIWSFSSPGHTGGWHSPTPMKLGRVMWLVLHYGLEWKWYISLLGQCI